MRPIAASYETDGSVFLLWERKAKYSDSSDGKQHSEDICGVTYVKKNNDGNASVIATFRQPTPVRASLSGVCARARWRRTARVHKGACRVHALQPHPCSDK